MTGAEYLESIRAVAAIRETAWAVPALEALHLFFIAATVAGVALLDLRLLGLALKQRALTEIEAETRRLFVFGFAGVFFTGFLIFLTEAAHASTHTSFQLKMATLAAALALQIYSRVRISKGNAGNHAVSAILAAASLLLWLTVGTLGRWIGFS